MSAPIQDFKDLAAWQAAMFLAVKSYKLASRLPPQEKFGLALQIRRCAVSIPSNIAEGYGRWSLGDYLRFLRVANGSLKELETQVLLAQRMGMVHERDCLEVLGLCQRTAELLTALIKSLKP